MYDFVFKKKMNKRDHCLCVSEWLLLNAKWAIFQLYDSENKLMRWWRCLTNTLRWIFTVLDNWTNSPVVDMSLQLDTLSWFLWWRCLTNTLRWIFTVLDNWTNSPVVDMSLQLDTLSWFLSYQYFLLLLNDVCSAEKQQIPIFIYSLWFGSTGAQTYDLQHSKQTCLSLHH